MTKYDNLKLDHQLCFALYAATHALTRAYRGALERAGLTYTQYLVMLVLWEGDGVSVGNIAQRLDLDSATLTPMLKRLETAGLVSRTRNLNDERVVEIRLTEAGNQLQDEIARVQNNVACQTGLGPQEFNQLKDTLHRLVETMAKEPQQQAAA
ncbi:MAG TPA: MarR family transcriptional regulator [Methylophilaceae bacterium]|jgi:DNA-binding MarR family transcriptional regulator